MSHLIPQMVEFTNQVVIALSNAYPPQVYSDVNQATTNPATIVGIQSISVDAFGVVTIQTSSGHGINTTQGIGACVVVAGVTPSQYNGAFVVIAIPDSTHLKVRNLGAIGAGAGTGGTLTVTTVPIISTFTPAFPAWTMSVPYAVNSVVQPVTPNGFYYVAKQGGTSKATEPTWPLQAGEVSDGTIIWAFAGALNTAAPPPPGCAHVSVYSGSLWCWDTSPTNTTTGLDGPCSLRMSEVNNLNAWNPINQAFLDKDDGTEGDGLAVFTISAQGIPPQGSLIAFKLYSTFQIVGVFGSTNFAIQRVITDMGCVSPRSIQFIPGYGVGRYAHLGIAVFDGVNDRIISPQVNPYLFATNDPDLADITALDAGNQILSWGAQTANPPMYVLAIPVGSSNGQLTRLLCFDLVLKAWGIVDLPFAISVLTQVRTTAANPVTVFGSFSDGTLQRWQAGDVQWATAVAGSSTMAPVVGTVRSPSVSSKDPDQRIFCRRVIIRGQTGDSPTASMTVVPRQMGSNIRRQLVSIPSQGAEFAVEAAVGTTSGRFDADVTFNGDITVDAIVFHVEPRPIGSLISSFA